MLVRYLGAMAVAVVLLAVEPANAADPEPRASARSDARGASAEPVPGRPRLRFRSQGPACMCLDGLSEAEIAAAERGRQQPADGLPAIIQNP